MNGRILITGGSGLLGSNWARQVGGTWEAVAGIHQQPALGKGRAEKLVLDNPDLLLTDLRRIQPDIVVHTAGLSSVDECENHPARAELINVTLAENVAAACSAAGIYLIHISTDHLFAGNRSFYKEEDKPEPLNGYARTKAAAEERVAMRFPSALILRTNFFGWGTPYKRSLSDWVIQMLREGKSIPVFEDVFFTPMLMETLIEAAMDLAEKRQKGIFNLVGDERLSKSEFAECIADVFGLSRSHLMPCPVSDAKLAAPRPKDMSLDNSKVRSVLGRSLGNMRDYAQRLVSQEKSLSGGKGMFG